MDRPIFIVACPRSGTGILYQLARLHPEVAWVTPFSNWVCGKPWFQTVPPPLAWHIESILHRLPNTVLPPLLRGPFDGSLELTSVFETHEGHSIWNRALPTKTSHLATEDDVTPRIRSYIQDVIRWHRRYHGRSRFLWKTPRNAFRVRFLHALFPEAYFVHLLRDGRAVAASILKRRRQDNNSLKQWWGVQPPGWKSMRSEPPLKQAAWMWTQCLSRIRDDASVLPNGHFLELEYEALARSPERELRRFFAFADLEPQEFFTTEHQQQLEKVRPPQDSWQTRLEDDQIALLEDVLAPTLQRCGYEKYTESA